MRELLAGLALRPVDDRVHLTLVDPAKTLGSGYAFESPRILNMRARTMSMHRGNPVHFHTWLEAEAHVPAHVAEFPPRALFGRYLTAILAESLAAADEHRIEVERWQARAVDVERFGASIRVTGDDDVIRTFDAVALTVGESRYQVLHALTGHPRFIRSPWDPRLKEIPAAADVAIVGAGLSAVDACIDLLEQDHAGRIACFTRKRGLPKVQGPVEQYAPRVLGRPWLAQQTLNGRREVPLRTVASALSAELDEAMGAEYEPGAPDAREWFSREGRAARLRRTENDVFLDALGTAKTSHTHWYYALDSLELLTPQVWDAIAEPEQLRFLRRHRALWNEFRHSMPIANGEALAPAIRAGQLDTQRGMSGVRPPASRRGSWEVTAGSSVRGFDYLIDATGGQPRIACEKDRLLSTCIARGSLSADVRGGIRVAFHTCRAEDASGRHAPNLYFVGPLTFGTHFYTNSFTTNRINATHVARQLELMLEGSIERAPRFGYGAASGATQEVAHG